jgi:hypothetical protein
MLLKSFLFDREHFVQYNGFTSNEFIPSSGIPQGSNLGPLLFILFINDALDMIVNSKVLMYADDFKIYKKIKCANDCLILQHDLCKLEEWCNVNNLTINISKCFTLSFSKNKKIIKYNYVLNDMSITRSTQIKDLGVIYDNTLSFRYHIEYITKSALKSLGFITRQTKDFWSLNAIKSLYFAFVRSKLEYAGTVWNPYYACHKWSLEKVQRKFLKYLTYKTEGSYPQQGTNHLTLLDNHQFLSLYCRRQQAAAMFLINLLCNKIDCPELLGNVYFKVPNANLRKNYMFFYPTSRTNIGNNTPLINMMKTLNLVCESIDLDLCNKREIVNLIYNIYKCKI